MKPSGWLMIALFLAYGIVAIKWGEVMAFENGFGWDGATYRNCTVDFPGQILNRELNSYSLQRVLPPGVIYFTFVIFGIPFDDANILVAFRILNLVSILVSIYIFSLIANHFRFKEGTRWLGFIGLFVNYAFIRQSFYYPVHTDTAVFALGLALLYFYIKQNYIGIAAVTLAGIFTWPSFIYASFPLFVFPYAEDRNENAPAKSKYAAPASATLALLIGALAAYLYYVNEYHTKMHSGVAKPLHYLVPVSIIAIMAYVYFSFSKISDYPVLYKFKMLLRQVRYGYAAIWLVLLLISLSFVRIFSGKSDPPDTIKSIAGSFLTLGIAEPLVNIISPVVYYGPFLLITILVWNKFCREIHTRGPGLTLYVMLLLVFSIGSESRRFINFFPVIVIFTAVVLDRFDIRRWQVVTLGLISLVFSKFWLKMNPASGDFPSDMNLFQDFPWQKYFMNIGPWMSHEMYFVQGAAVIVTGVIIYFIIFYRKLSA